MASPRQDHGRARSRAGIPGRDHGPESSGLLVFERPDRSKPSTFVYFRSSSVGAHPGQQRQHRARFQVSGSVGIRPVLPCREAEGWRRSRTATRGGESSALGLASVCCRLFRSQLFGARLVSRTAGARPQGEGASGYDSMKESMNRHPKRAENGHHHDIVANTYGQPVRLFFRFTDRRHGCFSRLWTARAVTFPVLPHRCQSTGTPGSVHAAESGGTARLVSLRSEGSAGSRRWPLPWRPPSSPVA